MAESSSAKIEPLLLLARSQKGAAAAKIAADATSMAGLYVFGELLQLQNIRDLQNDPTHSKAYLLLQLFAYGTLQTYQAATDSYPPLSPVQLNKLKHLTLVSLAMQKRSLSYETISTALGISSTRELENTIIDAIYAGLIGGKMYHQEKVLHVDWVVGRDVTPDELTRTASVLDSWCNNAQNLLAALDERISQVRAESHAYSEADTAYKALRETEYAALLTASKDKKAARNRGGGGAGAGSIGAAGGFGEAEFGRGEANERDQAFGRDRRRPGEMGDSTGGRKSGRRLGGGGAPAGAGGGEGAGPDAGQHGQGGNAEKSAAGLMGRLPGEGEGVVKRGNKRPRD